MKLSKLLEDVGSAGPDTPVKVADQDGKNLAVTGVEVRHNRDGARTAIVVTVKAG